MSEQFEGQPYHQDHTPMWDSTQLAEDEAIRFVEHPENSVNIGDGEFYGDSVYWIDKRLVTITGRMCLDPTTTLSLVNVYARLELPSALKHFVNRLAGRPNQVVLKYQISDI